MHMEKNMCDSLLNTLLNVKGKKKDRLNSRQDLAEMSIHEQLHPTSVGKQIYLPSACHTLSTKEKRHDCHMLM